MLPQENKLSAPATALDAQPSILAEPPKQGVHLATGHQFPRASMMGALTITGPRSIAVDFLRLQKTPEPLGAHHAEGDLPAGFRLLLPRPLPPNQSALEADASAQPDPSRTGGRKAE